jgi:hypothetical protein
MRDQYFVLFVIAMLVMGCQSKTEISDNVELGGSQDSQHVDSDSDTESESDQNQSGLGESVATKKAGTEPHEVCNRLMTLLKNEEVSEAQKLFTRKATAMMLRFNLPLAFPGQSDATFEVSPAQYATSKEELCQVMCKISEKVDGSIVDAELGWMLKRSDKNTRWRVSGMLLPMEKGKPMDFLNFESSADLGRLKTMLTGGPNVEELQANAVNE